MVAFSQGHWPFAVPLLEMDEDGDDWLLAVAVIEGARDLRRPTEEA